MSHRGHDAQSHCKADGYGGHEEGGLAAPIGGPIDGDHQDTRDPHLHQEALPPSHSRPQVGGRQALTLVTRGYTVVMATTHTTLPGLRLKSFFVVDRKGS